MERIRRPNIRGLDTIRFICAIWVVIAHCGLPPIFEGIDESKPLGFIIHGIYGNLWSGPSAVIVFFVVSGFCIHYPQAGNQTIPNLTEYFIRRYIRIGVPLVIAIILSNFVLKIDLNQSIFWSVFAEIIYYTIYPAILMIRRSGLSWHKILIISFVLALAVASTNLGVGNYPSFGIFFNWLLGLPCWLLGVQLAELVIEDTAPKPSNIWMWRIGTLSASAICSVLRHHSPIGYPWTLNIFAVLVFFWLLQEIRFYRYETPAKLLEWIGRWSYSIYLVHLLAQVLWVNVLKDVNLGFLANWLVKMAFILVVSYVFSVIVEMPTHHLARNFSRRFGSTKQDVNISG